MQAKLFFDKIVYSFCKSKKKEYTVIELHIDDPIDPKKTIDVEARFILDRDLNDEELVEKCLLENGIDPVDYETKNF